MFDKKPIGKTMNLLQILTFLILNILIVLFLKVLVNILTCMITQN